MQRRRQREPPRHPFGARPASSRVKREHRRSPAIDPRQARVGSLALGAGRGGAGVGG